MDHAIAHGDNCGVQDIHSSIPSTPASSTPSKLCYEGVWKSADYGVTWAKIQHRGRTRSILARAYGALPAIAPDASCTAQQPGQQPGHHVRLPARSMARGELDRLPDADRPLHVRHRSPGQEPRGVLQAMAATISPNRPDGGLTWSDAGVIGAEREQLSRLRRQRHPAVAMSQGKRGPSEEVKSPSGWSWTKVSGQHHVHAGSHQVLIERTHTCCRPRRRAVTSARSTTQGISASGGAASTAGGPGPRISAVASNMIIADADHLCRQGLSVAERTSPRSPVPACRPRASLRTTGPAMRCLARMINNGPKCMAVTTQGAHQRCWSATPVWRDIWRYVEASP